MPLLLLNVELLRLVDVIDDENLSTHHFTKNLVFGLQSQLQCFPYLDKTMAAHRTTVLVSLFVCIRLL